MKWRTWDLFNRVCDLEKKEKQMAANLSALQATVQTTVQNTTKLLQDISDGLVRIQKTIDDLKGQGTTINPADLDALTQQLAQLNDKVTASDTSVVSFDQPA